MPVTVGSECMPVTLGLKVVTYCCLGNRKKCGIFEYTFLLFKSTKINSMTRKCEEYDTQIWHNMITKIRPVLSDEIKLFKINNIIQINKNQLDDTQMWRIWHANMTQYDNKNKTSIIWWNKAFQNQQ